MGTDLVTHPQVESQLIARAKDGDEQAFEALYHAYRAPCLFALRPHDR